MSSCYYFRDKLFCDRVGEVIGIVIFRDFSMPELRVHEMLDLGVSSQMATFVTCPSFPVSDASTRPESS